MDPPAASEAPVRIGAGIPIDSDMASLSDAEILEQYKLARDTIVAAIVDGTGTVEYQIGSRRVRRTDTTAALREIERLIQYYETRTNATSGRARNQFSFRGRN